MYALKKETERLKEKSNCVANNYILGTWAPSIHYILCVVINEGTCIGVIICMNTHELSMNFMLSLRHYTLHCTRRIQHEIHEGSHLHCANDTLVDHCTLIDTPMKSKTRVLDD